MNAAEYLRQLWGLMPRGHWLALSGLFDEILQVWANELERVDTRAKEALVESRVSGANETLPDWEEQYGLPSEGTEAERVARLVTRKTKTTRTRPVDYKRKMAPVLGLTPEQVDVFERDRAMAIAMADDREIYRFFVYRDPTLPGTYSVLDAQVELERFSQSHTKGHVIESKNFLCDDPFSLCDRDILEGEDLEPPLLGFLIVDGGGYLGIEPGTGYLEVTA